MDTGGIMKNILATAVMMLQLVLTAQAHAADKTYRLGIFPYMAHRQIADLFGPIATSMQLALNHPVRLESVPTFIDFRNQILDAQYDIALIQPFDYPEAVVKRGYIPLAQFAKPLVTEFYVRDEKRYRSLRDLKNTVVGMPPEVSANARMALKALSDNKITPGQDLKVQFFSSHDSCLQAVWAGLASACATNQSTAKVFENRMHGKLYIAYTTPPIPHILFVAHPRVPASDRIKLKRLIIGWTKTEDGRAMMKKLAYPGFVEHNPDEYTVMSKFNTADITKSQNQPNNKFLVLGIFPYLNARRLSEVTQPLLPNLSKAVNLPVRMATASTFEVFDQNLTKAEYDIVLVQPFDFTKAMNVGYLPLAAASSGGKLIFVTLANSNYKTIQDIKGSTVALPPKNSAASIIAMEMLKQNKISSDDVRVEHFRNHGACVDAVQRGEAAICVTGKNMLKMLKENQRSKLETIAESENFPGVVFLIHKRVDASMRKQIQENVLAWPHTSDGEKILKSFNFGPFVTVDTSAYEKLAETYRISH